MGNEAKTPEAAQRQRLFFALWPEDALRQRLRQETRAARESLGGRAVKADNWHVTLAFVGSVTAEVRDCLTSAAAALELPGFDLRLNRYGFWARPRVFWLGSDEVPEPLQALVDGLNHAFESCGLEPERRPYRVHMTLCRKVRHGSREPAPDILWPVHDFALVESVSTPDGVDYRVLQRWPLQGANLD